MTRVVAIVTAITACLFGLAACGGGDSSKGGQANLNLWVFNEPSGGTTLAVSIYLIKRGAIGPDESVVVWVTGFG